MVSQGIIKESNSPSNSPMWIVTKKNDHSNREKWLYDYSRLNDVTTTDKFPIPNTATILDELGKAQYFTTIDLAKGF